MINPKHSQPQTASDVITFPRPRAPLAIFFLVVPALIIVMIAVNIFTRQFPIPLILLLAVVAGSCGFWIKTALEHIGDVNVEMSAKALTVKRLVGESRFEWDDIEAIKLLDPGSTLADSRGGDDGRVGIGLFLRASSAKREQGGPPEVMIVTATADEAATVIKASERIVAYQRKIGGGATAGGFGRQGKGLRRPGKPIAA